MHKILILGTGFGQLPLIHACREMGIEMVGIDVNANSLGAGLVDKFYKIDVKDTPKVLEIARIENITGAVTMQTDAPIPTLGRVNDELHLAGVSERTALACSNKDIAREALKIKQVSQPSFEIVSGPSQAKVAVEKIGLPCVLKAPDSSGSRGVVKLDSIDNFDDCFEQAKMYSGSGLVVVEEFIDGIEIGAQTFSEDGECLYCFIHNDTLNEGKYMVPTGHSYPCNNASIDQRKVKEEISKALNALGIVNGPANVDLIVSSDGQPYIIEIGARAGATCLPELTSLHSGLDWTKMIIRNALGQKQSRAKPTSIPCAALIIQSPSDGVFLGFKKGFHDNEYLDTLIEFEITKNVGEPVSILRKGTDRIGKVVVRGRSSLEAERIATEIINKISIEVR